MITPMQAFSIFVYADWAMLLVGVVSLVASIILTGYAIFPRNKGRRWPILRRAMVCLGVYAMYYATQCSVMIYFCNEYLPPLLTVLFALPMVVMLAGLTISIIYGVNALVRAIGAERRRMVLKCLLGVLVFGVGVAPHTAAMLIPIISAEDHSNREGTLVHAGESFADFAITTADGSPFNTADLRGRVLVLGFYASWCGPCQMELPHLQTIWDEFRGSEDFQMLVIGREESDEAVKEFRDKGGYTFPMAADPDASVFRRFASQAIPRTYLISRKGIVVYQWTGCYEAEIAKLKKLLTKELAKAD